MNKKSELDKKIEVIKDIFDINKILNIKLNKNYIQKYYFVNKIPYSIFHTNTDLIYMGISRDGKFKTADLLEAARTVEKYITKDTKNILELATGRGATSFYLAKKYPKVNFYGIDISKAQLELAFNKAKKLNNYHPTFGDYHNLKKFKSKHFDISFAIEALCYSNNKYKVLTEVHLKLKDGGFFIIFDGYAKNNKKLTENEKLAKILLEKGMAINKFDTYENFLKEVKKSKFKVEFEEDVSKYIIPTMEKFEKISKIYFKIRIFSKILSNLLPKEFIYNTIPGYLGPTLMKLKLYKYMITILRK